MTAHSAMGLCHVNLARGFRGGERQTELLIRELARRGYCQSLVARRGQPLAQRLRDVPGLRVLPISKPFIAYAGRLRGSLVHAHEAKAGLLAHWANRAFASPYILTRRVDRVPGANPLSRAVYRRAGGVVAISQAIKAVLLDYNPDLPITVIPSAHAQLGYNRENARRLRKSWGGTLVVGSVGALVDRHKGQAVLIEAARQLQVPRPDWRFVFVGGGEDGPALRKQAAGLPGVRFAGQQAAIGDYLAAFDLFVMPSRYEGLGSTLLDALAFGLPAVASAVGGIPEVLRDGVEGYLCPPGCAEALAQKIRCLGDRPELRADMARAARDRAQAFTAQQMATAYLRCYQDFGFDLKCGTQVR